MSFARRMADFVRRRPDLAEVAGVFVGSRLILAISAHLSHMLVIKDRWYVKPCNGWLDLFFYWDSRWYLSIAESGYFYNPGKQSNVAFFPLYPMAVKAVAWVTGSPVTAGFLVSNLSLAAAAFIFYELVRIDYPDGHAARRAVTYLLVTPASLFFSIFYTEGLFLFVTVAAVYAARRHWWFAAGVMGACAALTRTAGALIVLPIAAEYVQANWIALRHRKADGREILRLLGSLALVPGAVAAHLAHLYARFGDGLVFCRNSAVWGRKLVPFWETWENIQSHDPFYRFIFTAAFVLAPCALAVLVLKRARWAYIVFAASLMLLDMSSNLGESMPRYLGAIFPLYLAPALVVERWKWLEPLVLFPSLAMLALFTVLFVNGYWLT
jgi:hypothetical protein